LVKLTLKVCVPLETLVETLKVFHFLLSTFLVLSSWPSTFICICGQMRLQRSPLAVALSDIAVSVVVKLPLIVVAPYSWTALPRLAVLSETTADPLPKVIFSASTLVSSGAAAKVFHNAYPPTTPNKRAKNTSWVFENLTPLLRAFVLSTVLF
jgi:hypothetical protein